MVAIISFPPGVGVAALVGVGVAVVSLVGVGVAVAALVGVGVTVGPGVGVEPPNEKLNQLIFQSDVPDVTA